MAVSDTIRQLVKRQAGNRCGYCRVSGDYVYAPMEIDHLLPPAAGGTDDLLNLWLACPRCNRFKGQETQAVDPLTGRRVRLFNPRSQQWSRHFELSKDGGTILGKTICGRATVAALQINFPASVKLRQQLNKAGWYP